MNSLYHIKNITTFDDLIKYDSDIRSYTKRRFYNYLNDHQSLITADDLVNDMYIKIKPKFNGTFTLSGGYLHQTIHSLIINHLKDKFNRHEQIDENVADDYNEDEKEPTDEIAMVEYLKKHLDSESFDLLVLSTHSTVADLSILLNIKYSLLDANLKRIKEKAKKILLKYEQEK